MRNYFYEMKNQKTKLPFGHHLIIQAIEGNNISTINDCNILKKSIGKRVQNVLMKKVLNN